MKKHVNKENELHFSSHLKLAVIGTPLVGNEVVDFSNQVVPLSTFLEVSKLKDVIIWPVGSKGILTELNQMFPKVLFTKDRLGIGLDVLKSSGPSTCFIIVYGQDQEAEIKRLAAVYFHSLIVDK